MAQKRLIIVRDLGDPREPEFDGLGSRLLRDLELYGPIYSCHHSPARQAQATAEVVTSAHSLGPLEDPLLDMAQLGRTPSQLESFTDALRRVLQQAYYWEGDERGGGSHVAVVSASAMWLAYCLTQRGRNPEKVFDLFERLSILPGAYVVLTLQESGPRLEALCNIRLPAMETAAA